MDVNFGNLKRNFTCVAIDQNDEYAYCGTTTGDVLEINIERAIYKRIENVIVESNIIIRAKSVILHGEI